MVDVFPFFHLIPSTPAGLRPRYYCSVTNLLRLSKPLPNETTFAEFLSGVQCFYLAYHLTRLFSKWPDEYQKFPSKSNPLNVQFESSQAFWIYSSPTSTKRIWYSMTWCARFWKLNHVWCKSTNHQSYRCGRNLCSTRIIFRYLRRSHAFHLEVFLSNQPYQMPYQFDLQPRWMQITLAILGNEKHGTLVLGTLWYLDVRYMYRIYTGYM